MSRALSTSALGPRMRALIEPAGLLVASTALVGLSLMRANPLTYGNPDFGEPWDHHRNVWDSRLLVDCPRLAA